MLIQLYFNSFVLTSINWLCSAAMCLFDSLPLPLSIVHQYLTFRNALLELQGRTSCRPPVSRTVAAKGREDKSLGADERRAMITSKPLQGPYIMDDTRVRFVLHASALPINLEVIIPQA